MFSVPINDLTFEHVNDFCHARPREGVTLDYKVSFPDRLDKTIASFANTYGGHVLIGVGETPTGEPLLPISGIPLETGLRERVVAKALDAIYPPVYPEVKVAEFKSPGSTTPDRAVVVVRVHESDASAHAVDGGRSVYLRVDNLSEHFTRRATVNEVEWMLNKREKSMQLKNVLLEGARQHATNYLQRYRSEKHWTDEQPRGRYILWSAPTFPRKEILPPEELLRLMRNTHNRCRVANWSYPTGEAVPIMGGIRYPRSESNNYWFTEVNKFGLVYSEIGFTGEGDTNLRHAIPCGPLAGLIVGHLRFCISLYEKTGYLGLLDFRCEVTPTIERYPHAIIQGNYLPPCRSLEEKICLGFTSSVKETQESLLQRATESYREFLWGFGIELSEAEAKEHFVSFNIN